MVHRTGGLRLPSAILLGALMILRAQILRGGTDTALDRARQLYFKSIDDKRSLPEAVAAFDSLAGIEQDVLLITYRGALEALKGKYAIFPITKLTRAKRGLSMMDEAIRLDPDDLEIRFIRGCSSYHLPFFMGRKETALEDLRIVLNRLPDELPAYAPLVVERMITFLISHGIPSQSETEALLLIRSNLDGFLPFRTKESERPCGTAGENLSGISFWTEPDSDRYSETNGLHASLKILPVPAILGLNAFPSLF